MKKPRTARAEIERLRTELEESVRLHFAAHQRMERSEAERDALRADAERYRWLRQHHYKPRSANTEYDNSMMLSFHVSGVWSDNMNPRVLDGCIDAAMRGKEQSDD